MVAVKEVVPLQLRRFPHRARRRPIRWLVHRGLRSADVVRIVRKRSEPALTDILLLRRRRFHVHALLQPSRPRVISLDNPLQPQVSTNHAAWQQVKDLEAQVGLALKSNELSTHGREAEVKEDAIYLEGNRRGSACPPEEVDPGD